MMTVIPKLLIKRKRVLTVVDFLIAGVAFHGIRDALQILDVRFWYTSFGHDFAVRVSNILLGLVHLRYQLWTEGVFVIFEVFSIVLLLRLRRRLKLAMIMTHLNAGDPFL